MYKWHNPDLEQEMEFVQKIVHSIRSARSDYNLPKGTKTEGKHNFAYEANFWYNYVTVYLFSSLSSAFIFIGLTSKLKTYWQFGFITNWNRFDFWGRLSSGACFLRTSKFYFLLMEENKTTSVSSVFFHE